MEQLYKLKDTVVQYLSPKRSVAAPESSLPDRKRRRTTGRTTPSKNTDTIHLYEPISEPHDKKSQAALYSRIRNSNRNSTSSPTNRRKRAHPEEETEGDRSTLGKLKNASESETLAFEDEENDTKYEENDHPEDENDLDEDVDVGSVSPEDSPSQIVTDEEDNESGSELLNEGDDEDEKASEELEVSPVDKVNEYLARQAELALKKELIEQIKAKGEWHPDEVYLFERLSLRSFEELLPAEWQIDFRTLPETLFTTSKDKTFINFNILNSFRGKSAL
jgi:hypothetical protein